MNINELKEIWEKAVDAGWTAYHACEPIGMQVRAGSVTYDVPDGVCGFAWVEFASKQIKIMNMFVKLGICEPKNKTVDNVRMNYDIGRKYGGGYSYWVGGSQSMQRKEAFAKAMAQVLNDAGIRCYSGSRLD
jgi:hypothetical protein